MRAPLKFLEETTESAIRIYPRLLNDTIGKIFIPQQISLFHSKERAPLTILAHTLAVSAARIENSSCVFLDTGANYSPGLVRSLCESKHESNEFLKRIRVGPILGLDDVVEKIELLEQMGKISLVILDSITGALNLTGSPGSRGRQRMLFGTLDSIRRIINRLDTHLMITDYSSRNWVSGAPIPIGGNVLSHAVDSVVLVDRLRQGESLVRILIERSTASSHTPGIIVKIGSRGIRSMR